MIDRILNPFRKIYNIYVLIKNKVVYGNRLQIRGLIYVCGDHIKLGCDVNINSGMRFNPIGGNNRTLIITHDDGTIEIGSRVGISNAALVARKRIVIEDDVMIGGGCCIYDNDFHSTGYKKRVSECDDDIVGESVCVKHGAFIGAHSIVLKGVTIGEYSVVGAGSVVTKSIPSGEIWAGNPARYIGKVKQ